MAFSIFGKRESDERLDSSVETEQKKTGLFGRMKQAVARTRESLNDSIGSMLALTRTVDESTLEDLEMALLASDIGSGTASEIVEGLRQSALRKNIESGTELKRMMKVEIRAILDRVAVTLVRPAVGPEVIMMVGVNGTGKTTTSGKLAALYGSQGRSVLLCAADTFRAAAIEQLEVWAERVGCADCQDEAGRRSFGGVVRCAAGGESARDGCADRRYGGAAAYEVEPDGRACEDAADGGAAGAGRSASDAAGDGCDDGAERAAAGAAVYRVGAGDWDCADEAGWNGEGRHRDCHCERVEAAGAYVGVGEKMEDLLPFDSAAFVDSMLD